MGVNIKYTRHMLSANQYFKANTTILCRRKKANYKNTRCTAAGISASGKSYRNFIS